ncbi:type II toxin-antitoxin system Phd/YefM family antitoxin [Pleurocapsa sp. PCC 7319]|uniref:type II toxin-antitoxin system Phd/YefM family antitoxin n=1 Tax=Pleurocapsa sp. PCC 7319 TaxID=118161 RepID=UPI000349B4EC|nr:type II toxin-antitoxin system Phd/YefM family antitoxin [Pleurocapsa sp. PCC 7319]
MDSISVNQFREKLKHCVERVIQEHQPLKVTRRNGEDFVVISAEDWEREQETLYVLQNPSLMQQIDESQSTHNLDRGYKPSNEELDEIFSL